MNAASFAAEFGELRERIERLYASAPTPAVASYLRLMAEAAVVGQGYVDPEQAPLAPAEYADLNPGGHH